MTIAPWRGVVWPRRRMQRVAIAFLQRLAVDGTHGEIADHLAPVAGRAAPTAVCGSA